MSTPRTMTNKLRDAAILFATLMLFWLMLVNSLAPDTLLAGAVVALIIALLYRDGLSFFTESWWTLTCRFNPGSSRSEQVSRAAWGG
jgi:hypothetical protein